jgi:mono/diheme cytochrome c family protein
LIGNRRQGPDLANVGSRRSALWLRIHQIDPSALSYRSVMPSYAYLFQKETGQPSRGDDLIAYLTTLKSPNSAAHLAQVAASWHPADVAQGSAVRSEGAQLFRDDCATCHSKDGYVRMRWRSRFKTLPPDLATAPLSRIPEDLSPAAQRLAIARIIKFGIPGTDMAGHEYFADAQIVALAEYVQTLRADSSGKPRTRP